LIIRERDTKSIKSSSDFS